MVNLDKVAKQDWYLLKRNLSWFRVWVEDARMACYRIPLSFQWSFLSFKAILCHHVGLLLSVGKSSPSSLECFQQVVISGSAASFFVSGMKLRYIFMTCFTSFNWIWPDLTRACILQMDFYFYFFNFFRHIRCSTSWTQEGAPRYQIGIVQAHVIQMNGWWLITDWSDCLVPHHRPTSRSCRHLRTFKCKHCATLHADNHHVCRYKIQIYASVCQCWGSQTTSLFLDRNWIERIKSVKTCRVESVGREGKYNCKRKYENFHRI